nr:hypothetical protein Cduv_481 [Cedratvirus duvanny]
MQSSLAFSLANAIRRDGPSFIDDHNPHREEKRELLAVNLCAKGDDFWFFPGGYKTYQCKNPLYLDKEGRLHLSTFSQGLTLSPEENKSLLRGDTVTQRVKFSSEETNQSTSLESFLAQHQS